MNFTKFVRTTPVAASEYLTKKKLTLLVIRTLKQLLDHLRHGHLLYHNYLGQKRKWTCFWFINKSTVLNISLRFCWSYTAIS